MASFDDVHRNELRAANGKLRLGEGWRIALREPLEFASLGPEPVDASVTVIQFVAVEGGKLKPATDADRDLLADWKKRHRETPPDWFGLPEGLLGAGQAADDSGPPRG